MESSKPTRMEAAAGLALSAIWAAIVIFETLTRFPWNQGDSFQHASQIVHGMAGGVFASGGFVWLAGRSRIFRRA
jgi:hypothetical protein